MRKCIHYLKDMLNNNVIMSFFTRFLNNLTDYKDMHILQPK